MIFVRSLFLAAALAMPVTAVQIAATDVAAEASGKGKKAKKKVKKAAYKTCGTYKYWKGGKCLDARAKK